MGLLKSMIILVILNNLNYNKQELAYIELNPLCQTNKDMFEF